MSEVRLRTVVRNVVEKSEGNPLPFIGLEDLQSGTGRLLVEELPLKAANDSVRHRAGDVLFSKLRPYLAKSYQPTAPGTATGELLVLRPGPDVDSRFLFYVTLSSPWLDWANTTSYGTKMPRTSWEDLADYRLVMPPMEEQRRIAKFLDTKSEALIRAEKRMSELRELLAERRWSYFQNRVDRAAAPVAPLRRVLRSITDGPFGSAFSSSDYCDEGAAVVRLGNIGFAEYRHHDQAYIPLHLYRNFLRHKVDEGSILIAGLGDARNHAGRACVAPNLGSAIVKGKCFCARVDKAVADPWYIALLLSSPIGRDSMESRGSTRAMINLELVKSALVPLPSLVEQRRISESMNSADEIAREAVRRLARQRELVTERRQALITAAVTGQIDVTTARGVD